MTVLYRGLECSVTTEAALGWWEGHSKTGTRKTRPSGEKEPDVGRQGWGGGVGGAGREQEKATVRVAGRQSVRLQHKEQGLERVPSGVISATGAFNHLDSPSFISELPQLVYLRCSASKSCWAPAMN